MKNISIKISGKRTKQELNECEFFFIRPSRNRNAIETATQLLNQGVEEVFVTDDGFIAKTNSIDDKKSEQISAFISKVLRTRSNKLCSYYKIKK